MSDRDDEVAQGEREAAIVAAADLGAAGPDFAGLEQRLQADWGGDVSPHSVFWTSASEAVLHALAQGDVRAAGMVHLRQAHWLARRPTPASTRAARRFMHEHHVREGSDAPMTIDADSCATCRNAGEAVYTPAEALARMPIPNPDCELNACTCLWTLADGS